MGVTLQGWNLLCYNSSVSPRLLLWQTTELPMQEQLSGPVCCSEPRRSCMPPAHALPAFPSVSITSCPHFRAATQISQTNALRVEIGVLNFF